MDDYSDGYGNIFDRVSGAFGKFLDYKTENRLISQFGQLGNNRTSGYYGPNGQYYPGVGTSMNVADMFPWLLVAAVVIGGVILVSKS